MVAEDVSYNISGQGILRTYMYPYTLKLYNFLSSNKYDVKFHSTKQLGALQYLLKGAHHTRYEYMFVQWTLIDQIKNNAKGIGLNSKINSNLNLNIDGMVSPTPAELLQCLSILTNIGHFPDTFAASKLWLHLIRNNIRGLKTGLKKGLLKNEKILLDRIIDNNDYYNVHLINALFLLGRYGRAEGANEIINFSKKLLLKYINNDEESLSRYWEIFKGIRKISYILMDANYAPIPFNLDLSSILLNLGDYQEAIISNDSNFQKALEQINSVLETSLYLEPNSMIVSTYRGIQINNNFRDLPSQLKFDKVSVINSMLQPVRANNEQINNVFQNQNGFLSNFPNWDTKHILDISYPEVIYNPGIFPPDPWKFEQNLMNSLGFTNCFVSAAYPPNQETFRLVFSIKNNVNESRKIKTALKIVKEVIDFNSSLNEKGYEIKNHSEDDQFKAKLLKYLLGYTFGKEKEYTLHSPNIKGHKGLPIFIGRGSVRLSKDIEVYIDKVKQDSKISSDEIHELNMTLETVRSLNYRGLIIVFLGSTKMREPQQAKYCCEFDGIIYLPAKRHVDFAFVIEAKNYSNGRTDAIKQLKSRLDNYLSSELNYNLDDITGRGANASISLKV
jgi:hypothetical protein